MLQYSGRLLSRLWGKRTKPFFKTNVGKIHEGERQMMYTTLRILVSIVVLLLGMTTALAEPASAGGLYPTVMNQSQSTAGQLQNVSLDSDIRHLTLGQTAAIVVGAFAGSTLLTTVLEGGTLVSIAGGIFGVALGNEWYQRGMWPF